MFRIALLEYLEKIHILGHDGHSLRTNNMTLFEVSDEKQIKLRDVKYMNLKAPIRSEDEKIAPDTMPGPCLTIRLRFKNEISNAIVLFLRLIEASNLGIISNLFWGDCVVRFVSWSEDT